MARGDTTTRTYRDDESDAVSQMSSPMSLEELELQRQAHRRTTSQRWWNRLNCCGLLSRQPGETEAHRRQRKRRCCLWFGIVAVTLTIFGAIAGGVYITFVSILLKRLAPSPRNSGLPHIVDTWKEPDSGKAFQFDWRDDFSRDIVPKSCHSHNDYWRSVPLYAALAAGCTSIEADIWLTEDGKLRVSHSWESTTSDRTLRSLYIDPLLNILSQRNATTADEPDKKTGVFDMDPSATTVLLIDFKSDPEATWPILLSQLALLRSKNWLTYYNGSTIRKGPLTIVGTGNAPFNLIQSMTNRYIFFDAPLLSVSDAKYNTTNSYYASAAMSDAVGKLWFARVEESVLGYSELADWKEG
ncbi:hypothetical protein J4E91_007829 [Alternaria rosae]|nr:hypothetical protein J4E91_007829 [Alternaria rosae]